LAEDEEIVRDLTEQILKNAGYDVLAAGDGAEAFVLYEEHRNEIDGVVTDIVMPGLGGRGLARQIREHDAHLPIVFISGHHEETSETLQLGTGAALLQKPFSVTALVDTIGRLVGEETEAAPDERKREPTCVLADDHPAVLDSVSRFLESKGVRVSQARDGEEALATIRAIQPDVAIVDVAMAPVSGIDVAREVADMSPGTKVILYTGHNDRGLLDRALEAGARGFVLKEGTLDSLEEAVRTVAEGGTWVDSGLASAVASPATVSSLPPLTPREREILGLIANGLTNEKVATLLDISPETVQSHVRHAMVKLEADTRTEAVATALRHSLIS
jgi:DNA-binding NarL/FixJ family response regulator